MMHFKGLAVTAGTLLLIACNGTGSGVNSAGTSSAGGGGGLAGVVPSLVNVDLSNVLNDLAVRLNLDKANVPINAQIPITLAVNICGVSINVLSASTGGQANCTATTSSPELAQVVQQQMAAGGSVGGGAQGGSQASNSTPASGAVTSGTTTTAPAGSSPATASSQPTSTQP